MSRRLLSKDVDFLPCNRNLTVRKFQKFLWILAYLDVLSQFPRSFQVRFVASRFHSNFFGVVTNQSIKKYQVFLLHQKPGRSKVPKTVFHTELTVSSNLIFCVATRLVSPISVSVERSMIVDKGSIEKFLIWFLYWNIDVQKRTECFYFWIISIFKIMFLR